MDRIYVDTCVYVNLLNGDKDYWRDLGEFALRVFEQVRAKRYRLVISDWVIKELKKQVDCKLIDEFLSGFEKECILEVESTLQDKREAKRMSRNWPDALHVVLALKNDCVYLVTRDKDFIEFQGLIEIVLPESL